MDPITRAMQRFANDAEAFWRAHPGRLLPLVASDDDRAWVLHALRLREAAPDNRRPFVIHEAPFETTSAYFAALAEHIEEHYELVRKGAAEEGVELPPFASDEGTAPSGALKRTALAADRAARLLGERFGGIVIALVPERVADVAAWRASVLVLASARWSPRARFAVLAPPGGPLAGVVGDEGARIDIDAGGLLDAARGAASNASEENASDKLRALMLDAASKSAEGDHDGAVGVYERAVALCAAERMMLEEAAARLSLGNAYVAAQRIELAAESYSKAAELATTLEEWPLACQAWLGLGGALLPRAEHAEAAVAYRAAAAAAKRAEIVPLRIEALRMAGICFLRLGREDDAMFAWKEAVDIGAEADAAERGASAFEDVACALVELLERHALESQAQHVRAIGDELTLRSR